MNKRIKDICSWTLVISVLLSVMPGTVWATGTESSEVVADVTVQTQSEDLQASEVAESELTILEEDVSLRGEYEKHFLMSDGSYQAALYHEPVHQMQDGKWVEIDNTLSLQTSADGTARYATANGYADVSFARSFDDRLVTMQQGEYSLAWGVEAVSDSLRMSASVQPIQAELIAESTSLLSTEEQKTLVSKASSAIQYRNAFRQDVDLEYIVLPSRVKENIILQSPQDISGYMVTVYTENLSARLLESREIQFYNSSDEVIFTMTSPYMYDSAGELSEDIDVELISKGTGCYYIAITPDAQWLNDESRVYPVVIDPQVTTDTARTNIIDNYVLQGAGVQNRNLDRLYIGNRSEGLTRAFIKFDTMPTLPANATITTATMTVWLTSGASTGYTANAYKVTGGDWESGTITWANQPAASTLLASNISHNSLTKYSFSCLSAVQSWYSGSTTGQNANYGIMMRYTSESTDDYNAFYSADHTEESERPSITITYTTPSSGVAVDVGSTYVLDKEGITGTITWASSDTSVVTVNSSGKITGVKAGSASVTASVGGVVQREYTIYVTIVDGVYYMKSSTGLYMSVDGGLTDGTPVKMLSQATQEDAKLRQLWKIQYVTNGYYYIRSLYLATRALRITTNAQNFNMANITTIDTDNSWIAATLDCRWVIETNSSGYIFKHRETSTSSSMKCLRPSNTDVVTSHYVPGNSLFTWTLVKDTTVVNQVLFINPQDGTTVNNAVRYVTPGEKLTLSDLGFEVSFVSQHTNYQNIQWSSLEPSIAKVDQSTGTVTGVSPGQTTITARRDYNASPCLETYTITVLPFTDGTYLIKNRQYKLCVQLNSEDGSSYYSSGTTINQTTTDGYAYQYWTLTHTGDGYYKIISSISALALSVTSGGTSSSDTTLVQEEYLGYARQKWKIEKTDAGYYKIKAKSSEGMSNDLAIGVESASAFHADGLDVMQRTYTDDGSYNDEWYLIGYKKAYSMGGEFWGGSDVMDTARNWGSSGYRTFFDIDPDVSDLSYNNLNSSVLYFSSHGNQHTLHLLNDIYLADDEKNYSGSTVRIRSIPLTNTDLCIYDACLTASNSDGTGVNLCTATIDAGAKCVIGWTKEIDSYDAMIWQRRFQDMLLSGNSVKTSADYANSYTYIDGDSIKSWRIYGDEDILIDLETLYNQSRAGSVTSFASYSMEQELNTTYYYDIAIPYSKYSEESIKDVLGNWFELFSEIDCIITKTNTTDDGNDYVVDLKYLYNGYMTTCGYCVIVNDGYITAMRENAVSTLPISDDNVQSNNTTNDARIAPVVTQEIIDYAMKMAQDEVTQRYENSIVFEQSGMKYYDSEKSAYYYCVNTVYQTESGAYGSIITYYDLSDGLEESI